MTSTIERVGNSTDILGEGPVWSPQEQALRWVDIRLPAVRRLHPASGQLQSWAMPEMVGSLAVRQRGGLLLALRSSLSFYDAADGSFERVAAPEAELPEHRFNDGKCDRQGRFWAGTMNDVTRAPEGKLYRLDATGGCVAMADGIHIPNSLAWSPDGRTMYFADSPTQTIHAYPFDTASGELGARREFVRIEPPGIPDGAAVDAEGFLWCAIYGGWRLMRFAPDGRVDRVIELPVQQPTMCAFGGAALDVLYLTTASQRLSAEEFARQPLAGALLALDVGVRGLPEPCYAG